MEALGIIKRLTKNEDGVVDAVRRLGRGLPSVILGQLTAAKSVIVIEDVGSFTGFLDSCYGNRYAFGHTWSMCIDSALLQILPINLIHLHGGVGVGHNYTKLQSIADYNFRSSFIRRCLDMHSHGNIDWYGCGYYRLFILGDRRPLLITEAYTDGTYIDRRYWNYDRWSVYYRESR